MSVTPIHPGARRYDTELIAEAKRLAEGGWSAYKIQQIFARRGIPVSESAVRRWVDPRAAERQRASNRNRMRRNLAAAKATGPWFHLDASPAYRYARLVALAEAGLSPRSIATVLMLDFGDVLSEDAIRRAIDEKQPPRIWREVQAA